MEPTVESSSAADGGRPAGVPMKARNRSRPAALSRCPSRRFAPAAGRRQKRRAAAPRSSLTGPAGVCSLPAPLQRASKSSRIVERADAARCFEIFAKASGMSQVEDDKLTELQEDRRRLQDRLDAQARELSLLRARFARYETALRGSHVTVFTQDSASALHLDQQSPVRPFGRGHSRPQRRRNPAGRQPRPPSSRSSARRWRAARPSAAEFALADGPGLRWHDLHVEPLRDGAGAIVGLTGAAVDVTERKEGEAHLRLLLRELTHRSKNLLAVIQAMARQTARHAGSIDGFPRQFGARLQALAASHDLLIRESWYGASLERTGALAACRLYRPRAGPGRFRGARRRAQAGSGAKSRPCAARAGGQRREIRRALGAGRTRHRSPGAATARAAATLSRSIGASNSVRKCKPRRKRGFGSMVIERNLARALDAQVNLDFAPDGVRCHIVIPAHQILAAR